MRCLIFFSSGPCQSVQRRSLLAAQDSILSSVEFPLVVNVMYLLMGRQLLGLKYVSCCSGNRKLTVRSSQEGSLFGCLDTKLVTCAKSTQFIVPASITALTWLLALSVVTGVLLWAFHYLHNLLLLSETVAEWKTGPLKRGNPDSTRYLIFHSTVM